MNDECGMLKGEGDAPIRLEAMGFSIADFRLHETSPRRHREPAGDGNGCAARQGPCPSVLVRVYPYAPLAQRYRMKQDIASHLHPIP